jgi:hypothetical protein
MQYPIKNRHLSPTNLSTQTIEHSSQSVDTQISNHSKNSNTTTSLYYHIRSSSSSEKLSDLVSIDRLTHPKKTNLKTLPSVLIPTIYSQRPSRLVNGAAEEFTVQPRCPSLIPSLLFSTLLSFSFLLLLPQASSQQIPRSS